MQNVLIDTDIAIDFLRGEKSVKNKIISLWKKNLSCLSLLSVYELYAGMRDHEQEATDAFIHACKIVELNTPICRLAGEAYRHHRKKGTTLTTVDCLIYATAKINDCKIFTRNVKHYPDKKMIYA